MIRSCTSLLKQIYLYITNIYNLLIHNNDSIFIINPRPSSLVYMYIQIHFLSLTFFFSQEAYDQQKKRSYVYLQADSQTSILGGSPYLRYDVDSFRKALFLARTPLGKNRNTFSFPFRHFTHGNFQSNCFSIFYSTPSASSIRGGGQLLFFGSESFWRRYFVFYWFKGLSCSSLFMVLSDWFFFRSPFHDVIWLCLLILQTMC